MAVLRAGSAVSQSELILVYESPVLSCGHGRGGAELNPGASLTGMNITTLTGTQKGMAGERFSIGLKTLGAKLRAGAFNGVDSWR